MGLATLACVSCIMHCIKPVLAIVHLVWYNDIHMPVEA
jgi:hypothetical protein